MTTRLLIGQKGLRFAAPWSWPRANPAPSHLCVLRDLITFLAGYIIGLSGRFGFALGLTVGLTIQAYLYTVSRWERWGGKTGQMNSTCRGEGEGLNCKTRRQRSCVLKACRGKRCFGGHLHTGEGGHAGRCRGSGKCGAAPSPSVQSNSQESSQLRGHRDVETAAQTKENTQTHINM